MWPTALAAATTAILTPPPNDLGGGAGPPRPGADQQIQRPDWLLLRDITERTLLEYPVGLSLPQFALASTLGTPPAVERREELGYRSLADLLRSMPGAWAPP